QPPRTRRRSPGACSTAPAMFHFALRPITDDRVEKSDARVSFRAPSVGPLALETARNGLLRPFRSTFHGGHGAISAQRHLEARCHDRGLGGRLGRLWWAHETRGAGWAPGGLRRRGRLSV